MIKVMDRLFTQPFSLHCNFLFLRIIDEQLLTNSSIGGIAPNLRLRLCLHSVFRLSLVSFPFLFIFLFIFTEIVDLILYLLQPSLLSFLFFLSSLILLYFLQNSIFLDIKFEESFNNFISFDRFGFQILPDWCIIIS